MHQSGVNYLKKKKQEPQQMQMFFFELADVKKCLN